MSWVFGRAQSLEKWYRIHYSKIGGPGGRRTRIYRIISVSNYDGSPALSQLSYRPFFNVMYYLIGTGRIPPGNSNGSRISLDNCCASA